MNTVAWPPPSPERDEGRLWLQWLVRLRWVAILAQIVTLPVSFPILDNPLLVVPLLGVSVVLVIVNLTTFGRLTRSEEIDESVLLYQLGIDVVALTAFFLLAGGPDNPFTLLYVIHIAMGAVMLTPRHAALLTVGVVLCYGALYGFHLPLHLDQHAVPEDLLQRFGQLVAFSITTISVAVFVVGLAGSLRRRKQHLLEAQTRTARTDRLRSVGTLAAGAAHELNTPLSTMGLRIRRIGRRFDDQDTQRDVQVIREQLDRCKRIVEQLLVGAGNPSASGLSRARMSDLVEEAVTLWAKGSSLDVDLEDRTEGAEVELPKVAFVQGLINLLENAREAQEEVDVFEPLAIDIQREGGHVVISITDHGCGLPEDDERVGDPFYTTKPTGTGLGVFVARAVADGAGGGLSYVNNPNGTTARWRVPLAPRRPHERQDQTEDAGRG